MKKEKQDAENVKNGVSDSLDSEMANKAKEDEAENNVDAVKDVMEEDKFQNDLEMYQSKYEQKAKELEEINNRYLRLQADFINYKRRVEKEKETIFSHATEDIVTKLLPVVDNLERALSSVDDKENSLYKGVEMVYNQFIDILRKLGMEEIEALGTKFDPNLHHGVAQEESADHDEDTIIEVFQKGYRLKDKIIRPSMVKIAK